MAQVMRFPSPTEIKTAETPSRTTYTIDGPVEDVEEVIERLMARWPSQGYGTTVTRNIQQGGRMKAVVSRANSCD